MPAKRTDLDPYHALSLYESGLSARAIAVELGCSNSVVNRLLREANATIRDHSAAGRLRAARETPEAKAARYAKASAARTGVPTSDTTLAKRAATRQNSTRHIGKHELDLAAAMQRAGLEPIKQLAVGPYNLDLAVGTVDVEVHTAAHGPHLLRRGHVEKRSRYLADRGWFVLYVWAPDGMRPVDMEQVVGLVNLVRSNPSAVPGEYLVLRCHGYGGITGRPKGDH